MQISIALIYVKIKCNTLQIYLQYTMDSIVKYYIFYSKILQFLAYSCNSCVRIYSKLSCICLKNCSKTLQNQWYITAIYNVIYLCAVTIGHSRNIRARLTGGYHKTTQISYRADKYKSGSL